VARTGIRRHFTNFSLSSGRSYWTGAHYAQNEDGSLCLVLQPC